MHWFKTWTGDITRIPPATLCRFLKLVLTSNLIEFNGYIKLQMDGMGMGLVLCPQASNGVMKFIVANINSRCITRSIPPPSFDGRFMDDRWQLWFHSVEEYVSYVNECNNDILKFTTEGPPALLKNFLDLTVFIMNNKIETCLYRNPV
jgi:hypothetical protein